MSIGFGGYIGFAISPDGYAFFDPEIRSKDRETAQKGQKYEASDHRHRITAEILDFKTKTVTFDSGVTRLLFDWIKLKVTVAQYPPVK